MTNTSHRRFGFGMTAIAAIAALGLTACGGQDVATGNGDEGGEGDQTLIIAMESEAATMDAQSSGGWVTWRIHDQMFDRLVNQDLTVPSEDAPQPELIGGLAESWDISDDGTEYTFHIREGVEFHDGTELDAEAIEFNIRRMWDEDFEFYEPAANGQTAFVWQFLEDIEVTDDYEIVLRHSQPFSEFLRMVAERPTYIMSPTAIEEHGEDIEEHPTGTGPFQFEQRVHGERIDAVRNENYWGEPAQLDGVSWRPIPDASGRTQALRNGEVDMIAVPHPDAVEGLLEDGYELSSGNPPHMWYFYLNHEDEAFGQQEVRQAVSHAIDREGLAEDLLQGTAIPAYDVQPEAAGVEYVEREEFQYDPDRAQELLEEAGYGDGLDITLMTSVDGSGQLIPAPMAEYIQEDLAEVGINAEIETMEWVSYLSRYAEGAGDAQMMQFSWGMTTPFWIHMVTHSNESSPEGRNGGYYNNPELDEVLDAAAAAVDPDEAADLWLDAHDIIAEDVAILPIIHDTAPYIMAPEVEGFVSPSQEWYDLTTVSLNWED